MILVNEVWLVPGVQVSASVPMLTRWKLRPSSPWAQRQEQRLALRLPGDVLQGVPAFCASVCVCVCVCCVCVTRKWGWLQARFPCAAQVTRHSHVLIQGLVMHWMWELIVFSCTVWQEQAFLVMKGGPGVVKGTHVMIQKATTYRCNGRNKSNSVGLAPWAAENWLVCKSRSDDLKWHVY